MAKTNSACECWPTCTCHSNELRAPCSIVLTSRQVRREHEGRNTGVRCRCQAVFGRRFGGWPVLGYVRGLEDARKIFRDHQDSRV